MQTSTAAMKKTRYGLFLNNTNASTPSALDADAEDVFPFGGVSGNMKLKSPSARDAIESITKVFSIDTFVIINPARIQPTVPKTRIHGNCFPGSVICENAILFESAIVGI